jgi:hypothetical protein
MFKNLSMLVVAFLLLATPVLAQNPVENLISGLRAAGFQLVLLWLLTLAVVYGILSHVEIPKSMSARGVISISLAFLVLLAAAAGQAATFVSNLVTASILVAFGLMFAIIFLEIAGAKHEGKHVLTMHPRFFGIIILILAILIFIGAGGLGILNLPSIDITTPVAALVFFLVIMAVAVWVMFKESGGK